MAQPASSGLPPSLALVAKILDASPLPTVILDGAGGVRHLNPPAARMAPEGLADLPGRLADLLGSEAPKALEAALDLDAFSAGAVETLCQERIGFQSFRMSVTALDVPLEGRFLVAVLHQGGDLPGPTRGAQQLREDAMQAVIDAFSDAVLLFDAELRCVLSNGLAHEATGYSGEALTRLTLVDLGIVKDADEAGALLGQASSGQGAGTRSILVTGRGEKLPVRAQVNLLLGSSTRAVGLCSFSPPRVTSGRLAAVRQSGTFGRPAAAPASPVKVTMGAVADTPAKPAEAAKTAKPLLGAARPAGPAAQPSGAKLGAAKSGAASAPGSPPVLSSARSALSGAPETAAAPEVTEPSGPPEALGGEAMSVTGAVSGGVETTLELGVDDLELQAAPPPVPGRSRTAKPEAEKSGVAKPPAPAGAPPRPPARSTPVPAPVTPSTPASPAAPTAPGAPAAMATRDKTPPVSSGVPPGLLSEVLVRVTASPSRVLSVEGALEPLLGYLPQEVTEWTAEQWLERMHEPSLAAQLSQMWRGLVGQKFAPGALPEQTMEYALVRKDGGLVPCRTIWRAIQAADGTFEGLELVIQPA